MIRRRLESIEAVLAEEMSADDKAALQEALTILAGDVVFTENAASRLAIAPYQHPCGRVWTLQFYRPATAGRIRLALFESDRA